MKRTHHQSTDAKMNSKPIKLNPIGTKRNMQSFPVASSPTLPKQLPQIDDPLITPKLNREIKSQIQFTYSPKRDALKMQPKAVNSSRSPPLTTDKNQLENESKQKNVEYLSNKISKLQVEAKNLEKAYKETTNNISVLEKKLFRIQFNEKSHKLPQSIAEESKNGSQENLEIIEGLVNQDDTDTTKKILSEQSKAYTKLEETYCNDTNALKREIERLKGLIKKQDTDLIILRSKLDQQVSDQEELQKKLQSEQRERQNEKSDLIDQISEKNNEIFQLNDILNKIKLDRKNKDESLKDFQRQVLVLTNYNKILDSDLNLTKRSLTTVQQSLETEKEKSKFFDIQSEELTDLRNAKQITEDKLKETLKSLDFVTSNYNFLQNKYNTLKEELEKKDSQLQELFEKFSESNSNPKISLKPMLRRTSTLNAVTLSTDPSQKETFNRLYSKISSLEEEIQHEKIDKEKLSRNLEYSKKIIDEKLHIITRLENKVQSDYFMQIEFVKKSLGKDVRELLNVLEHFIHYLQGTLTCAKCKVNTNVKFISWDCEHVLCKTCAMFRESCPECSQGSRLLKLKLLKKIYCNFPKQLDTLLSIRELFRAKNEE